MLIAHEPHRNGWEAGFLATNFDLMSLIDLNLALFILVGFLAQMVDGALGMAYGITGSTVLMSIGVPPAQASATIHAAEVFTTGASGISHIAHRNLDWKLFWRLAPAGILGGVLGAYVLTNVPGNLIKPFVCVYLAIMGGIILSRAIRGLKEAPPHLNGAVPLGFGGGFLDAVGGGGWGPVVASTLLGRGHAPRFAIGTVNTAEFFVTVAISATFVWAIFNGGLGEEDGLAGHARAVLGLVIGGLIAAPIAGYATKLIPARILMGMVGALVIVLASWQGWQVFQKLTGH
ncbi:MAG: sulfite exporter TauE/SafE family protein [Caulobacterales bacterium]